MESKHRTLSDKIWLVLKGLAMGAANKVPGVSGGVVAYVAGFYEEFIYSLQKVNKTAFKLLLGGRIRSFARYVNGRFLFLLIFGMIISYFSVSKILDIAIEHYPLYVWSAFFGMIIGSVYIIAKDFNEWSRANLIILCLGIVAGIGISLLKPATQNDNLIFVFFCGIIGVSGMTLPGLSGSFILILLGNYVLLLVDSVNALFDTISDLIRGDFSFINNPFRIRLLKVLAIFTLGSATGLVTLSNFLAFLLKRFKNQTNAAIIGFITGSLGVVWPWKRPIFETNTLGEINYDRVGDPILTNYDRFIPTQFSTENIIATIFIFIGIVSVMALGKYGENTRA
ncbi:DUF368 domain-containing protein [Leeuwenhoekiella sp. MAR_2009_132]|uniref:DUF368 domain-containing protein n=1 Tax=Leeuwenhoekiella sp. MAR_2009_132 TaxID=1392489 RepID=UPI0004900FE3|nr:DUF368 domain-containing protein [Leeuwenhoekiella sp. MAR_2009_132]